ncbi:hypothetical protein C8R41DRAFT_815607 [Lentinula lateritia]|uniref:Uncharacterized protein n=1 Tax=Lentinula lateritia TaxID=40482 RepID=A0ABQ8VSQ9_9AGAR|nr:hypothetical protein C8R41DRAFT_815607 [Lentinula lateritia]
MTFMLSNVRDNHEDAEHSCSSGTKRKSLSLLPSSPTKLKRVDRSHSRGSSLSLLTASSLTTSAISRLSSLRYSKRSGQLPSPSSRKSPPICTISLESVTVNICDEDRNLSKSYTVPSPLETVDVNVIPFPKASSDESEPQPSSNLPTGRRRRSNHLLLGHRRSSSVHSISSQHKKENLDSFAFPSPRVSPAPKRTKSSARMPASNNSFSAPKASSYSFKDIRFIALIRRSIMHGITWREEMKACGRMDIDGGFSSGSVTFDILSDSESDDEGDETADPRHIRSHDYIMHNQDVLLVDRLGKHLSDWGYREREPFVPLSPPPTPLRMPLAPVALSTATVTIDAMPLLQPSLMAPLATGIIHLPNLEGHATRVSFLDKVDNQDMDVDRPERPTSPVARLLEPAANILPITEETSEQPSPPHFESCPSSLTDAIRPAQSQQHPVIVVPKPIPSPPPVSPFAPGSLSSHQRVLSPSQLVATLVLRHREKTAVRSRGCSQVGNDTFGKGMRRPSPLACEL